MNSQFEHLCEEFNIDGTDTEELTDKVISKTHEKTQEISENLGKQKYTLEDYAYMKTELINLIDLNKLVLNNVSDMCKVGAPPRMFETFSKISETIAGDIMKMAELQKTITDYQMQEQRENLQLQMLQTKTEIARLKVEAKKGNKGQNEGGNTYVQNNFINGGVNTSSNLLDKIEELKKQAAEKMDSIPLDFDLS